MSWRARYIGNRQTGPVIDLELARRLQDSGLRWEPTAGDRFVILRAGLQGQVFTVAEMTIEVQRLPSGEVLAFNGTTEWALDSVPAAEAVWLPAEHQLRRLLGGCFRCLRASGVGDQHHQDHDEVEMATFEVVADLPGVGERRFPAAIAEDAYALAVLELLNLAAA